MVNVFLRDIAYHPSQARLLICVIIRIIIVMDQYAVHTHVRVISMTIISLCT